MTDHPVEFSRILLKLSGEALKGAELSGIDPDSVAVLATKVREIVELGKEVALVIGAGNLFRGLPASRHGIDRATADNIGMLATVMNALAMADALDAAGVPAVIQSAFPMPGIADPFDRKRAVRALAERRVVLFAAGTGHPYFTTDTTAALRACEIRADAILKATKVDGIYSADPRVDASASRYRRLSYTEALVRRLQVMDATAFSLCMENRIPIVVFNFARPEALRRVVSGDTTLATVVWDWETVVDSVSTLR
jgi:uridylate kinase